LRPGNPRALQHALTFHDTSGQAQALDRRDPRPGYSLEPEGIGFVPAGSLGSWTLGDVPRFLPDGTGMPLPRGADVVIQALYHKTGKPELDQSSIGLYFAREPTQKQLRILALTSLAIDIPPGAARYEARASWRVVADMHAVQIAPHMHLLGKA